MAYCPDLLCSLVSFRILRHQGLWWDTKSEPTTLKRADNTIVAELQELYGQWVLEYRTEPTQASLHALRTKRSPQKADAQRWHRRLGHPGPSALEHLVQQSEGVRIKGITTVQCDACGRAKLKRQVRRTPRRIDEGPGERLAIDFHDYEDGSSTKEKSQMLITDRFSGFLWDFYFKDNRPARSIISTLSIFVKFLKSQFNITVKVIETDNEIVTVKQQVEKWCTAQNIRLEPSAPDTQAQNGGAERSGGVIKEKARAMRLDANLPWDIWPEIVRTAVYLRNRTPNYLNRWKTPYEVFYTTVAFENGVVTAPRKPDLTHLRTYGCKAFAMTDDTRRGKSRLQRLDPKAWIGYLVGYRSSNIFRVWIPSMGKTINTRDVIFDEDTVFSGKQEDIMDNLMHNTLGEIAAWVRSVELPPTGRPQGEPEMDFYEDETIEPRPTDDQPPRYDNSQRKILPYPTPPTTPPPVALLAQLSIAKNERTDQQPLSSTTCPWAAAFMAGTESGSVGKHGSKMLDKAAVRRMLSTGRKPHRSQLPLPPSSDKCLEDHPLFEMFKEAEKQHLNSHRQMNSWVEIAGKPIKKSGQQILDCMWVYTYKLDKHHRLQKCKARLVVRGDQQRSITAQDTYAATLASHSFRMLMAIAARHDLELKQYDVTNAFVHATIDRDIYMRMPRGYRKPGTILKLQKALYGLRISPLLWQREFTATLRSLGFSTVPHEPCCMIKNGIIIFFYVDDIIVAYKRDSETAAQRVVEQLKEKYTLTGGKDLQWFLGVEIIRDRQQKKIWLSQASYIDKIVQLANRKDQRHDTPMSSAELKPRSGLASPPEINQYQRKIGSLLFAAVTTRPDIAFATSRLARFLANPGTEHQEAADRVLLYLYDTRTYALQQGGENHLVVASDASFADNTLDRKSSQGYVIKLFGGWIAWRANKQDTVTTSTTEAELLALSQVAKEAMFTRMLLNELRIKLPDSTITIQCDNQQTIRLITEEITQLQTKLRHVDIHNHWLRQEVGRKTIQVVYVPSAEMLADGLTKALPKNKWTTFLEQIKLMDVKEKLIEREQELVEIEM